MSTIGGPKGPSRSPALQRFLDTERAKRTDQKTSQKPGAQPADQFAQDLHAQEARGLSGPMPAVLSGGSQPGAGALSVRLGAMTGQAQPEPLQPGNRQQGIRVVSRPEGRVVEGDARIERTADLQRLEGVVRIEGSLELSETLLDPAALDALSSLIHVDGGLAIEGNAALTALDQLVSLQRVAGNVYLGFNDELERVSFPMLQEIGGPLIIEGNDALKELDLPALTEVGGYLHLHENEQLAKVGLGALTDVRGELSVLENPQLLTVEMRALERVTDIEMSDNGADQLNGLPRVS